MSKVYRFDSDRYRVQLRVLPPLERWIDGKILIDDPTTNFVVKVLEQHYDKNTSFSIVGSQVYFGDSFSAAWGWVCHYCPGVMLPKSLRKYSTIPMGKPLIEVLD